MQDNLRSICERAMEEGLKIDLAGCNYGKTTGPCAFLRRPTKYYHFLAGMVRSRGMTRILEIGTHFGGSIMSMERGLSDNKRPESKLVSVDIERKNEDGFKKYPRIKRITGDSLDEKTIKEVCGFFKRPIDLVYIDSLHEYEHTKENMEIYAGRLNPRYVAIDDIRQCDSMRKLWAFVKEEHKDNAFDASDVTIREGAGFGVIRWRRP